MQATGWQLVSAMLKAQTVMALLSIQLIAITGIRVRTDDLLSVATIAAGCGIAIAVFVVVLALVRARNRMGAALRDGLVEMRRVVSPLPDFGIVGVAVAAGISEELFFRAFLQSWLAEVSHASVGMVVSSLLFGVLHFNSVANFVLITVYGLALALVYHVTQSLTLVVVWHAVYDMIALYLLLHAPRVFGCSANPAEAGRSDA